MVWTSQDSIDDAATGVESVKAKPLKKRCGSRAGLSRYYSSKSQSFSSLDKVQCTPFGMSALALAKRPSSFDLRRGSSGLARGHSRLGAEEVCMSTTQEEDEEDLEEGEEEACSGGQCPCNDTIFADHTDAFISPEGSPSTSPLQLYGSCSLSTAASAAAPFAPHQPQPHQHQHPLLHQQALTTDYLDQLTSALLPFQQQPPPAVCRSCSSRLTDSSSCTCSSCCSGGGHGVNPSSCMSSCDSGSLTATASPWPHDSPYRAAATCQFSQPSCEACRARDSEAAGSTAPSCCGLGAGLTGAVTITGGRPWQSSSSAAVPCSSHAAALRPEASSSSWNPHPQCCSSSTNVGWGSVDASGDGRGIGGSLGGSYGVTNARNRNCLSTGGCASGMFAGVAAAAALSMVSSSSPGSGATGPAVAVSGPPPTSSCAAAAAAAAAAVAALSGGSPHVRRLGLCARHRLRLSVSSRGLPHPNHPNHGASKPLWGCAEDLIASLTLSDKQGGQPGLARRSTLLSQPGRTSGSGGGIPSCGAGAGTSQPVLEFPAGPGGDGQQPAVPRPPNQYLCHGSCCAAGSQPQPCGTGPAHLPQQQQQQQASRQAWPRACWGAIQQSAMAYGGAGGGNSGMCGLEPHQLVTPQQQQQQQLHLQQQQQQSSQQGTWVYGGSAPSSIAHGLLAGCR